MPMDYDIHAYKVGRYSCKIFRDLMFQYLAKDYFINAPEDEVIKELNRYQQGTDNIPSPFIAMLLEDGKEKILIDTGIGFSQDPLLFRDNTYNFKGRLTELLGKENIKKNEITHVILTHLHPDHIGGLYDEPGNLNFPDARFIVHEEEWNYWFSSRSDNQPPLFKYFIEKNISGLKNHNLQLVRHEQEVLPGITLIEIPGHTPGQIAISITSEKDKLLYISDAVLHPLHIEHLNWQTNYDLDQEKAKASRKKVIDLAYGENMTNNAFHFDFPGLGKVDKQGNSWKWIYESSSR